MQNIGKALPFWASLLVVPMIVLACVMGGWWFLIPLAYSWGVFTALDDVFGLNLANLDPDTSDDELRSYQLVTLVWPVMQAALLLWAVWYLPRTDHSVLELIGCVFVIGLTTGILGINYSHELLHQASKMERRLADILLSMVFYSHFRSEHLLVHHIYVGTPKDPVTARWNEGFHRFFPRVLKQSYISAFKAEQKKLARADLPWYDRSNPFFLYWGLQALVLTLGFVLSGWAGILILLGQAFVAVFQLELTNYVEHYGLTRKHLGDGKYEPVKPHHSWNASHTATNWLLINLQRHSDHHYKPKRRFPLLQTYDQSTAPQLPYGYVIMGLMALYPPKWRAYMNPRVEKWRSMYYPEIIHWRDYNKGTTPMPR